MSAADESPETQKLRAENTALAAEVARLRELLDASATDEPKIRALRESEARYRSVVTSMSEGIVLQQADAVILTCNAAAERMLGLTADQMMGRTSLDPRWRAIHEDGSPFPGDTHPAPVTLRTGKPCRDVVMGVHKPSGELTWISINTEPIFGADPVRPEQVVCSFTDITAFKAASRALTESEENLRLALRAARMGTWRWDVAEGRVHWSESVESLFGLAPGSFAGTFDSYVATVHPDDRRHVRQVIDGALSTPEKDDAFHIEHRVVDSDGKVRWLEGHGRVFRDASGHASRMAGAVLDISARKELEAKFLHSQKMETVGRLAGGVAHDFNNLLTVILNATHLALLEGAPAATQEYLDLIRSAAERAARVTQQLLAFAKRQMSAARPVDVNRLVFDLGGLLKRLVGDHIQTNVSPATEAWTVLADAGQLEQVLVNLVVNARDAMPSGGTLSIATSNVLGADPHGDHVLVEIRDTGHGMTTEALARAFEPFYTTKVEGTGLGLATSQGIVQDFGGSLTLSSVVGEGTIARITLPRTTEDRLSTPHAPATRARRVAGATVLAVEDDPLVRRLVNRLLRDGGYEVLVARSGAEAVELSRTFAGPIDVLLTDVVMPGMSGMDLATAIAVDRPSTKVLYVSGYAGSALHPYGFDESSVAFLAKPYTASALTEKIRSLLGG